MRKVASRFIRSDEEPAMMEGDEVYALLLHWSAKEALFKLVGVEEVDFIRHLRIFPFSLSEEGEFEACEYRTGRQLSLIHICTVIQFHIRTLFIIVFIINLSYNLLDDILHCNNRCV